jgi:hypothetical protein
MLSLVERGRAAMRRLEEILETQPEIASQSFRSLPMVSNKASNSATSRLPSIGKETATARWKGLVLNCPWANRSAWSAASAREEHRGSIGTATVRCLVGRNSSRRSEH